LSGICTKQQLHEAPQEEEQHKDLKIKSEEALVYLLLAQRRIRIPPKTRRLPRKKDFKIGPANIENLDESINESDDDTEFLRLGPEEAHPVGPNGEYSSGGTLPMAKHMLAK